jgi:hypothetical protein
MFLNQQRSLVEVARILAVGGDPADDEYPDKPKRMRWSQHELVLCSPAGVSAG